MFLSNKNKVDSKGSFTDPTHKKKKLRIQEGFNVQEASKKILLDCLVNKHRKLKTKKQLEHEKSRKLLSETNQKSMHDSNQFKNTKERNIFSMH